MLQPLSPAPGPRLRRPRALTPAILRTWWLLGRNALLAAAPELDALNVFPVADGDTGANLLATWSAGCAHALPAPPGSTEHSGLGALAGFADAALRGARGNSGSILSAWLEGLADVLAPLPSADAGNLARALTMAAARARSALMSPVEGTVLTVADAAAGAALEVAGLPGAASEPGSGPAPRARRGDPSVATVARRAADTAAVTVQACFAELPALARAGVIDAGGQGLVVLLDALARALEGAPAPPDPRPGLGPVPGGGPSQVTLGHVSSDGALPVIGLGEPETWGYEVQCLVTPLDGASDGGLRSELAGVGTSVAVVVARQVWRVHVHVADATGIGPALEAMLAYGSPRDIEVTPLAVSGAQRRCVIAYAPGDGLAELFAAAGALLLEGRPEDPQVWADAVLGCGATEVVLLPNDVTAEAAAAAAALRCRRPGRLVVVVPARSPAQGLAALAVTGGERRLTDDVISMTRAAGSTRCAELVVAEQEAVTSAGRCAAGDVLGIIDGDVAVIGHEAADVALEVCERMLAAGGELVTLLAGRSLDPAVAAALALRLDRGHPLVEVATVAGGQPGLLLVGVE